MRKDAFISLALIGILSAGTALASAHYVVPVKVWTDGVQYSYIEVENGQTFGQPAFGPAVAFEVYDAAGTLLNSGYKPYGGTGLPGGQFAVVLTPALATSLGFNGDDNALMTLPLDGQFCLNDTAPGSSNHRWYCVHWGTVTPATVVKSDANSPWGAFSEAITVGIRPCHEVARSDANIVAGGGGTWTGDAPPITLTDSQGNTQVFVNPACGNDGGTADSGVTDSGQPDAGAPDSGQAGADGGTVDAGTGGKDSGTSADAGGGSDGGTGGTPTKGCGCGSGSSVPGALGLAALLIAMASRLNLRRKP